MTTSGTDQVRVDIHRVTYANADNGFTVLKAKEQGSGREFTATGHFAGVNAGEQFELFGEWTSHPKFGKQFKIERAVPLRPGSKAAIEKYLASGRIPGIGPKTATKIVEQFGDATLDILDNAPQRLSEVESIGRKKVKAIVAAWADQRAVADVMMFLNQHGISPLFATRIYKLYGQDSIHIVSRDPYRLATEVHGIGFLSADKVAQSLGIAKDSPERLRAAILYQLKMAEDRGHCFLTSSQLINVLEGSLALDRDKVIALLAECLGYLNDTGALISEPFTDDEGTRCSAHYRSDLLVAEWNIVHLVQKLLTKPLESDATRVDAWLARYCEATDAQLSEEQWRAVRRAATERIFVLTGGPGVGKTTTANAIIRLLKAMGKSVALGAPTGRAAQRMTEVSALPARTIHRMLEWQPALHGFARDESNPLTVQAVIIDEASMLDVRLADALIRAVPDTAQLILIGDVDQLPSVGPGNVLRDLIQSSQVPYSRLSEIFRQASCSRIIQTAHAINNGDPLELSDDATTDCRFLERETVEDIKMTIHQLLQDLPREFGFDPLEDIQILTPMNRGDLGTQTLNEEIQNLLNPLRPGAREFVKGSLRIRQGDKVIQSANNYDLGVFNGDIGFVCETHGEGGKLRIQFGERSIVYDDDQAMDLRLAYAITIHKSQGSEFKAVIMPTSMQHYIMLQRNLMYTGLTRAKQLAVFVGAKKALSYAVSNQTSAGRQTRLSEKLREQCDGA